MRRKSHSQDTMAHAGDVERTMIGAMLFVALLIWGSIAGQASREPAKPMGKCGDPGVRCLSDLAYAPGERTSVHISAVEVRK